jgi:site-specific DNA-methyltransferase (adenine-specific)
MRVERIGNATLYHGDCLEVLPTLASDVVITDPPYGFGAYATDDDAPVIAALAEFKRKAVFGYPEVLCRWCAHWGEPDEWVTWWPTNKPSGRAKGLSRESEAVAIYGELFQIPTRQRASDAMTLKIHEGRGNSLDECKEGDVWREPSPGCGFNGHLRNHPNEKPVAVMDKLVMMCSQQQECVFDPFMGSGTTGVSCLRMGRTFIGVELDPEHFETACQRIENAQRQERLFA